MNECCDVEHMEFFFGRLPGGGSVHTKPDGTYYLRLNSVHCPNMVICAPRSVSAANKKERPAYAVDSPCPGEPFDRDAVILCGQPFCAQPSPKRMRCLNPRRWEGNSAAVVDSLKKYIANTALPPGTLSFKHRFGSVLQSPETQYIIVSSNAALQKRQSTWMRDIVSVIEVFIPSPIVTSGVIRKGPVDVVTTYVDASGQEVAKAYPSTLNTVDVNRVRWSVDRRFVAPAFKTPPRLNRTFLDILARDVAIFCGANESDFS